MTKVTTGATNTKRKIPDPGKEIEDLRERVRELEETLDAIRSGEVDAIIVAKGDVQQIYTLEGTDHPYQILVENIQEGVLTLSRTGMILYTNTRFAEMVKLPDENLPGTSLLDYICPEHCLEIDDAIREIQGRNFKGRARIQHGSSSLPVSITMTSLSQEENTTISVVITDRSSDEKQIHFQARMLDAVGEAVVALDIDKKIIYWNDAASMTYGWKRNEVLGSNFVELTGSKVSDNEIHIITKLLKKGESWSGEYNVRHRDGHWFPIFANSSPVLDDNNNLIAVINSSHDITERKLAEVSLKESEARYRHLVMNAPAAIYEISADGLRFLSVNETVCRILGYTQEELLEMNPFDILDKESQDRFRERVRKRLSGEDIDESVAYRIIGRTGHEIWATLNIRLNDEGAGTLVVAHDITERKVAEEKLQTAYKLTSSILDSINGSFIALDGNWQFTYINQRAALPDVSPEDLIGKSIWEVFPEIIGTPLETIYREVMTSRKPRTFENASNVTSGRYFELHVYPLGESDLAIFGREITERKEAEMALREAHKRTATILEGVADTFYSLDNQWRFTTVNPAAEKAPFGRPAAEMLGKIIWELYPALMGTRIHQHYLDTAEKHSLEHYEAKSPLNGRWYEVFMQGREGGVDVYMRDTTERKKIEETLYDSERRYRELVENANSIIIRMDTEGKISFFNEYAQKFFGYTHEEIMGQNVRIIVPPTETRGRPLEGIVKAILKDPDDFSENENENLKKNGDRVWILWRNKAIRDSVGKIIGNLAIGQDITERKRAEEALRETEERFRLALKNAPVSVAIQDTNLVFIWAYNQRSKKPEEIIGKTDPDIFIPEDATRLIELKRKVIDTGKEVHEQIWLTLNGKRMYFDLYLEPLRNNNGHITGIGVATVDQTLEKLSEIALRDSEKRLREANDLLEAVTDATKVIIAAEDTNFRYTYFNKTYAAIIRRLTGKEIMTGMSMIDLFSDLPEEQRSELNEWSKVLSGQSVNERIKFDELKKAPAIYNVLHVPLRNAKWEIIGAGEIAFDVTSQVKVEETLRETSQYLTNLIDYANAPIIVWDPRFRITLFNHAFEHLTGRKAKEVIGHHLEILFPESYLSSAMDLIQKTSEGERWESVEIPILHKKGTIRTVLWNSAAIFGSNGKTIVATIAQGQDITDRKKIESEYKLRAAEYAKMNVTLKEEITQRESAETNLKQTLSLLNASFESTADGILVVDREGRITGYNQNFVNMWNIPMDMEKTRGNLTLINYFQTQIKDPEKFLLDMKDLLAHPARESYDVIELTDGRIFERYSKPQKIGKSAVGRVWSYRDITDRRRSEERLVASLQEKEVLLREIHHRVKNNLQLVTGLLDMTRMRTRDEATASILTDMMLKIQTMAQIHTRLYESKQFGKIGLTGQFRDQIAALSNIYSYKGHEICCEINAEEIFLPVDQALPCALVVNEILSNSYKHAFKGKTKGSIVISAVQENGEVRITVRDDGIGMPADFDIGRANSLGLKLIRTLVEHQLKGCLTINSLQGTETIIEFPIIIAGT